MAGRTLPSEAEMNARGYGMADMARRRAVLRETLTRLQSAQPPNFFYQLAAENLARWSEETTVAEPVGEVRGPQLRTFRPGATVAEMVDLSLVAVPNVR